MRKKNRKSGEFQYLRLKSRKSGETIAEVMVSMVIFLLLIALLQGSVAFCTNAQKKSRQIREDTSNAIEAYWRDTTGAVRSNGEKTLAFRLENGTSDSFSVKVDLAEKTVSYQDSNEESQTEESQTGESQSGESQTEENQTEESQTEESQSGESPTEENPTEENPTVTFYFFRQATN